MPPKGSRSKKLTVPVLEDAAPKEAKEKKVKEGKEQKSKEGKAPKDGKSKEAKEPKVKKEGKEAKTKEAKAGKESKEAKAKDAPAASTAAADEAGAQQQQDAADAQQPKDAADAQQQKGGKGQNPKAEKDASGKNEEKKDKKEKKDKEKKDKKEKKEKKDKSGKAKAAAASDDPSAKRQKTDEQEGAKSEDDMLGPMSEDEDEHEEFWKQVTSAVDEADDAASKPEANPIDNVGESASSQGGAAQEAPWWDQHRQQEGGTSYKPGQLVEAKYGNSFFDAEVLEVSGDSIRIRYHYDKSEADLPREDVKPKPEAEGEAAAGAGEAAEAEPEVDWTDALEVDIGWEATAHLLEGGGWRTAIVEKLAGAKVGPQESGNVRYKADDTAGTDKAKFLLKTLAAVKAGNDVHTSDVVPEGLEMTVINVPEERKGLIQGKLLKMLDDHSVIAAFVDSTPQAEPEAEQEALEPGQIVEAKYGNSFFEAEVVEVGEGGIKVKYKYDNSEAELPRAEVKAKPKAKEAEEEKAAEGSKEEPAEKEKEKEEEKQNDKEKENEKETENEKDTERDEKEKPEALEKGQSVEAKFGNSFFPAEILEVTGDTVKVKYDYDKSEAELPRSSVKVKATKAADSGSPAPAAFTVGQMVEAKFGSSFFEAEVLEVDTETLKVKYKWDSSEAELPRGHVRLKSEFSAGQAVEAKFGNSFFEAEVVEASGDKVKVKYMYDKSEAELPAADVKAKAPPPPMKFVTLRIFGEVQGRGRAGIEVFNKILPPSKDNEGNVIKGQFENLDEVVAGNDFHPPGGDCGISVVQMTMAGRVIGYQGKIIKAIKKAVCQIETKGTVAFLGGRPEERSACECVMGWLQNPVPRGTCDMPAGVESMFTRVLLPSSLRGAAIGQARDTLNKIEEDCAVMGFVVTTALPEFAGAAGEEPEPAPGQAVEAKYGNSFFSAEVIEVGADTVKVKYDYDKSEAELPRADVREKLEGEALEARLKSERLADLTTVAFIGTLDARRAAEARLMGILEMESPGTYLPSNGGETVVALSDADQQRVTAELQVLKAKKEEEDKWWAQEAEKKKWEEQKWEEQKWEEQKWAEQKQDNQKWGDNRWGEDKREDKKWEQSKGWGEDKKWSSDNKWDEDKKRDSDDSWGNWKGEEKKWEGDDKWRGGGGGGGRGGGGDSKQWGSDDKWWEKDAGGGNKREWGNDGGDNKRQRTEASSYSWQQAKQQTQPEAQQPPPAQQVPPPPPQQQQPQYVQPQLQQQQQHQQFQQQQQQFVQQPQQQLQAGGQPGPAFAHQPQQQEIQQLAAPVQQQPVQVQLPQCDPRQRLQRLKNEYGIEPATIEVWCQYQEFIWEGHSRLPEGWIRCWSRSQDREYYVRTVDMASVFDIQQVYQNLQGQY